MAVVRSAADSAKKFVTRARGAKDDYKSGVMNAGPRWQAGAESAEQAWKDGTTEAMNEGRFGRGVRKSGTSQKYQNNAVKLGPDRFAQGVENAEAAYSQGVQPYISAMAGFEYGPKGARGSSQNRDRISRHIDLMRATRKQTLGIAA